NVLIGVGGTADVPVDAPLDAILVAPYALVNLATTSAGHRGSVFARAILHNPNAVYRHDGFDPAQICDPNSLTCDPFCPCPPGGGGTCTKNADCSPGGCAPSGHCGEPGATCTITAQCVSGLDCSNGTCTPHCVANPKAPECLPSHCSNHVKDAD